MKNKTCKNCDPKNCDCIKEDFDLFILRLLPLAIIAGTLVIVGFLYFVNKMIM